MPGWLLRAPGGEIPIEGVCVIGRSTECEIPLDDPNASRRHAELSLVDSRVVVRDLESRNGTFVDGKMIGSPTTLGSNSRIIIGHTVLTVIARKEPSNPKRVVPLSVQAMASDATNTVVPDKAMLMRAQAMFARGELDESAGGVSLLLRRQCVRGRLAEDEIVRDLSILLVALAQRTGDTRWLEGLFQVNADCERMVSAEVVDAVEGIVQPGVLRLLPAYVEKTSTRAGQMTPAERVLLARLERLA